MTWSQLLTSHFSMDAKSNLKKLLKSDVLQSVLLFPDKFHIFTFAIWTIIKY